MIFMVLEGHPHIARIFQCNFRIYVSWFLCICRASCTQCCTVVLVSVVHSVEMSTDSSQQSQPQPVVVSDIPAASTASTTASTSCVAKPVSTAEGNLRSLLAFRVDPEDDILKQHLATAGKNAIYISKTTQNELIP